MTSDEKLPAARDPKTGRLFPGRRSLNPAGRPKILGHKHAMKLLRDASGDIMKLYLDVIQCDREVSPRQWDGLKHIIKLIVPPHAPRQDLDDEDTIDIPPPPVWDPKTRKWMITSENLRGYIGPPPWEETNSETGDTIEATGQETTGTMRTTPTRS